MSNRASPQLLFGAGGAVVLLGLLIFVVEPRWIDATGTVTAVKVNNTEGRLSTGYRPYVTYRYEVDGMQYHTSSVWCAPPAIHSSMARRDALEDAAKIELGDPIPIRYSARSAEEVTCLVDGRSEYFYLGLPALLIGGFLLLFGAHELLGPQRSRRGKDGSA